MAFSHARQNFQIKLSAKEMFEISQEISRDFSPNISSSFPQVVRSENRPPRNLTEISRKLVGSKALNRLAPVPRVTLSRLELLEISREINRKFAPRFFSRLPAESRFILSAQEMLMISEEVSREFAPKMSGGKPELVLLPVDPWHLHAYWTLDQNSIDAHQEKQAEPEQPLTLRLYPGTVEPEDEQQADVWFDVVVDGLQGQQKVELPASSFGAPRFSAVIGKAVSGQAFTVYARSKVIFVPWSSGGEKSYLEHQNARGLPCSHKHVSGQGKETRS